MSFVKKGEKKMRNMAKAASSGADDRGNKLMKDSFGKKGDGKRPGADHNMAANSKDKTKQPVSEDIHADDSQFEAAPVAKSSYDPASGKRAKSVADLRSAAKLITERSLAGEASPTGSEEGQDAKHLSSSKNESGFMNGAGMSDMDKKSKKAPRGEADQMGDEMEDPMDEDQEDSGQAEEGMTPKGKSRKKSMSLKEIKRKLAIQLD